MTEETEEKPKPKGRPKKLTKVTPKRGIFIERDGGVVKVKAGTEVELTTQELETFKGVL